MLEELKSNHFIEIRRKGILYKTINKTSYLINNHTEILQSKTKPQRIHFKIFSCHLCFGEVFLCYLNFFFYTEHILHIWVNLTSKSAMGYKHDKANMDDQRQRNLLLKKVLEVLEQGHFQWGLTFNEYFWQWNTHFKKPNRRITEEKKTIIGEKIF